jgi:hypothetical protein
LLWSVLTVFQPVHFVFFCGCIVFQPVWWFSAGSVCFRLVQWFSIGSGVCHPVQFVFQPVLWYFSQFCSFFGQFDVFWV